MKDGKSEGEAASRNKLNEVGIKLNHIDLKIFYKKFKYKINATALKWVPIRKRRKQKVMSKLIENPLQAPVLLRISWKIPHWSLDPKQLFYLCIYFITL